MPVPRSVGKSGGKGGNAGGKNPKGGRREDRSTSPGGNSKLCFEFAKSGTCQNGADCRFGHVSPSEATKMGLTQAPPKGGKGGKNPNKGGKNAAAAEQQQQQQQQQQQSNGQLPCGVVVEVQQHQEGAAEVFAAAYKE